MEDTFSLEPENLIELLPIIEDFIKKKRANEKVDTEKTVREAASVLGIDDIEGYAKLRLGAVLSKKTDEDTADKLAAMIVSLGPVITEIIVTQTHDKMNAASLVSSLNSVYMGNKDAMIGLIKQAYSIELPPETDDFLARYSIDAVAVYCFIAAYKIYKKAADDARIAHEKRLIIEQRCRESVSAYEQYHLEMETLVDKYLGTHLNLFESGIEAMDDSILADDVDGYIAANARLQKSLGRNQQFHTQEEFNDLMESDDVFKL